MQPSDKKFWKVKAAGDPKIGEVYIYGDIASWKWDDTDVTAASFKDDLDALGDIEVLNIYVNSYGGSLFQGLAIHNQIKRHPAKTIAYVDGVAASAASIIVAAADVVKMPANTTQMIHWLWMLVIGNANDMRKAAEDLDRLGASLLESYTAKAGDKLPEDKLREFLDNETWLTAQECLDYGLCDELLEAREIAASVDSEFLSLYKNVPESLKNQAQKGGGLSEEERQSIFEAARESKETINKIMEVL